MVVAGMLLVVFRRAIPDYQRELTHRGQDPHYGLLNIERGRREQELYEGPADAAQRLGVAGFGLFLIVGGGWVIVQTL